MKGIGCALLQGQSIEEEHGEARRNLWHASRLALNGQLLSAILHEMHQPLTAVRLRARNGRDMIDAGDLSVEEMRLIFDHIETSVAFATDIIERLRLLSEKRPLELKSVDLNEAVREMIGLAEIQAKIRQVKLEVKLAPGLPNARADRVSIQHAVLNLVMNGMDALAPDGERRVILETRRGDGCLEVLISDTGTGIHDDHRVRLFQPFFTTKPEGTGLGLAIAQSIVEAHGGHIAIEDCFDPHTCFRISLPLPARAV